MHSLRLVSSRSDRFEDCCEGDRVGHVVTELQDAEPLYIGGRGLPDASGSQGFSRALVAQPFRREPTRQHTHISRFGCRRQRLEELFASVSFAEALVLVPQRLDFAFEAGHGVR